MPLFSDGAGGLRWNGTQLLDGASQDCIDACCAVDTPFACCFPDGSCSNLTQMECQNAGGVWNQNILCADIECPILGACCYENGSCAQTTELECMTVGGNSWTANTPCAGVVCPTPPPCCASGNRCYSDGSAISVFFTATLFREWAACCSPFTNWEQHSNSLTITGNTTFAAGACGVSWNVPTPANVLVGPSSCGTSNTLGFTSVVVQLNAAGWQVSIGYAGGSSFVFTGMPCDGGSNGGQITTANPSSCGGNPGPFGGNTIRTTLTSMTLTVTGVYPCPLALLDLP